jgi:peroxiredoxin
MAQLQFPDVNIEQLAATRIYAGPDQTLLVGQLWQKQTVVLVFLRHFACIACRAHAAQVWSERAKYEKSGAKIIFIGNGQPNWIEIFRQDLGIDTGVVLTDPSLLSFKEAGFKSGFFNLVRPESVLNLVKLSKDGYTQTTYTTDA